MHGKDRRTPIADAAHGGGARDRVASGRGSRNRLCGSLRRFAETIGDIDWWSRPGVRRGDAGRGQPHSGQKVVGSGATKTSILNIPECSRRAVVSPTSSGRPSGTSPDRRRTTSRCVKGPSTGAGCSTSTVVRGGCVIPRRPRSRFTSSRFAVIPPPLRENSGEIQAPQWSLPDLVTIDGSGRLISIPIAPVTAVPLSRRWWLPRRNVATNTSPSPNMGRPGDQRLVSRREGPPAADSHASGRLSIDEASLWRELNTGRTAVSTTTQSFDSSRLVRCLGAFHFDLTADRNPAAPKGDGGSRVTPSATHRSLNRPSPGIDSTLTRVGGLAVSGVRLEVNGARPPRRFRRRHKRAVAAGVRLVISTDSHHTSDLKRMAYGVSHAQRGWAASSDVANTLPQSEFLEFATSRR